MLISITCLVEHPNKANDALYHIFYCLVYKNAFTGIDEASTSHQQIEINFGSLFVCLSILYLLIKEHITGAIKKQYLKSKLRKERGSNFHCMTTLFRTKQYVTC